MRKTPMGTCQQPCSVVRDPSGTPFVVSKNNTRKRSFGWITIKIHHEIKYLKVPTYVWRLDNRTLRVACLEITPYLACNKSSNFTLIDPPMRGMFMCNSFPILGFLYPLYSYIDKL